MNPKAEPRFNHALDVTHAGGLQLYAAPPLLFLSPSLFHSLSLSQTLFLSLTLPLSLSLSTSLSLPLLQPPRHPFARRRRGTSRRPFPRAQPLQRWKDGGDPRQVLFPFALPTTLLISNSPLHHETNRRFPGRGRTPTHLSCLPAVSTGGCILCVSSFVQEIGVLAFGLDDPPKASGHRAACFSLDGLCRQTRGEHEPCDIHSRERSRAHPILQRIATPFPWFDGLLTGRLETYRGCCRCHSFLFFCFVFFSCLFHL